MSSKKNDRRKTSPYLKLVVFTIASAGVINAVNKARDFVSEKTEAVRDFFRERIDKMKDK